MKMKISHAEIIIIINGSGKFMMWTMATIIKMIIKMIMINHGNAYLHIYFSIDEPV